MLDFPTRTDRTGLKFLQFYPRHNVFHPGIDFNYGIGDSDFGQPVIPPTWGITVYVSPRGTNGGLGNYLVLYHPHLKAWTRYLHLEGIFVTVGQKTPPKQPMALLGDSGTDNSHLHFEVLNERGLAFIRDFRRPYGRYPTGLSKQKVASMWLDPIRWIKENEHPLPSQKVDLDKKLEEARKALETAVPPQRNVLLRLIDRLLRQKG